MVFLGGVILAGIVRVREEFGYQERSDTNRAYAPWINWAVDMPEQLRRPQIGWMYLFFQSYETRRLPHLASCIHLWKQPARKIVAVLSTI
jgi:hypothetical protein